jgi:hypothetical protein
VTTDEVEGGQGQNETQGEGARDDKRDEIVGSWQMRFKLECVSRGHTPDETNAFALAKCSDFPVQRWRDR